MGNNWCSYLTGLIWFSFFVFAIDEWVFLRYISSKNIKELLPPKDRHMPPRNLEADYEGKEFCFFNHFAISVIWKANACRTLIVLDNIKYSKCLEATYDILVLQIAFCSKIFFLRDQCSLFFTFSCWTVEI